MEPGTLETYEIYRRWDGDGANSPWANLNKKYGYFVFALSCVNIITIGLSGSLKVRISPRASKKDGWLLRMVRRLVYFPLLLQVLIWLVFMSLLLFIPWYLGIKETPDYIHFKISLGMLKRAGRVGLALYPLIIFLSLKPNPLPNVLYMHLIPLHKWISRVCILSVLLHSLGFFGFWIHKNELHKTFDKLMFPGVVNFLLLFITLLLGIRGIRERCYKLFYALHIITAWVSVPLMYLHSMPEANLYVFGSLYLLVYHTAAKIYLSYNIKDKVDESNSYYTISVPESGLMMVRIPLEKVIKASTKFRNNQDDSMLTYFSPGSHIRISPSFLNPKSWLFATHPYTIASLDNEEYVDLVLKRTNKFALHLASQNYFCYTVSLPFPAFDEFFFTRNLNDNISIVSGGSGLAFGLPIFKYFHFRNKKASNEEIPKHYNLRFCVIVRQKEDLFVLKESGILCHQEDPESGLLELSPQYKDAKIDIFVTGTSNIETPKRTFTSFFQRIKGAIQGFRKKVPDTQYYQMDDLEEPMLDQTVEPQTKDFEVDHLTALKVQSGRPVISTVLSEYHETAEEESSLVVACGPSSLLTDCEQWTRSNQVEFLAESFAI